MQRFVILEELALGGTGIVYKARDEETGGIVALKKLNPSVEFPEREVLFARTIAHPNVCKVFELFREDGHASFPGVWKKMLSTVTCPSLYYAWLCADPDCEPAWRRIPQFSSALF